MWYLNHTNQEINIYKKWYSKGFFSNPVGRVFSPLGRVMWLAVLPLLVHACLRVFGGTRSCYWCGALLLRYGPSVSVVTASRHMQQNYNPCLSRDLMIPDYWHLTWGHNQDTRCWHSYWDMILMTMDTSCIVRIYIDCNRLEFIHRNIYRLPSTWIYRRSIWLLRELQMFTCSLLVMLPTGPGQWTRYHCCSRTLLHSYFVFMYSYRVHHFHYPSLALTRSPTMHACATNAGTNICRPSYGTRMRCELGIASDTRTLREIWFLLASQLPGQSSCTLPTGRTGSRRFSAVSR